jgi:protein SCO1/2
MRGRYWAGVAAVALLLGAGGLLYIHPAFATNLWGANYFPNVPLITQDGATVHLYDDLLKGKAVAINLIYTSCKDECPLETARLVQVQRLLGDRVG